MIDSEQMDNYSDEDCIDISDDELHHVQDAYYFGNELRAGRHDKEEVKKPFKGLGSPPQRIPPYFERCKKIGRIGPPKTELDRDSAKGEFLLL